MEQLRFWDTNNMMNISCSQFHILDIKDKETDMF